MDQGGSRGDEEKEDQENDGRAVTVELMIDMHCADCARKVERYVLRRVPGVESASGDYVSFSTLTVKGRVDPCLLRHVLEDKTKQKVTIFSLSTTDPTTSEAAVAPPDVEGGGGGENKDATAGLPAAAVAVQMRLHCTRCAEKVRRTLLALEGVEEVSADLEENRVEVKGVVDGEVLVGYIWSELRKNAEVLIPADTASSLGCVNQGSVGKGDEDKEDGGRQAAAPETDRPSDEAGRRIPEVTASARPMEKAAERQTQNATEQEQPTQQASERPTQEVAERPVFEHFQNGSHWRYAGPYGTYGPLAGHYYLLEPEYQTFSDENPNARCTVM